MKKDSVEITVNEQTVKISVDPPDLTATGADIKTAAVEQGVHIEQNFVLQQELPNGTSKIIGDTDNVKMRNNLRFTAIAPDDNS